MKSDEMNQATLAVMCAWCHRIIAEDEERFARGARARESERHKITGKGGSVVSIKLTVMDREILAIVPTDESPAKAEGNDVVFQTCSTACADELEHTLMEEWKLIDKIG